MMFCSNCGNEIQEEGVNCPNCGVALTDAENKEFYILKAAGCRLASYHFSGKR